MKAKVMVYKVRVKDAGGSLSVKAINSWEKLDMPLPAYSDITRLSEEENMDGMSFDAIRMLYVSVN